MSNVLEFTQSDLDIGLKTRPIRSGPELDLTNLFLHQLKEKLSGHKRHYALFYEPLLPTGFPDIVVVSYNPKKYLEWGTERSELQTFDLKILHHLHYADGATPEDIEKQLGLNSKSLIRSIERLLSASLIRWYADRWTPISLRSRYGINNIRSIEVKIKDWKGALQQASLNRWFASESYVLFPVKKPSRRVLKKSENLGVGIYSLVEGEATQTIKKPVHTNLPASYASWMFNEWIGRQINN